MKISTKGRYAIEAVLDLAIFSAENEVQNLKNIAERRGISEKYLEQIFIALKKEKIVNSVRGSQGGYLLARDPGEITAGEVIRAVEGPLSPVSCVARDECRKSCGRFNICVTRILWESMMKCINETADSVTLKDLMKSYKDYNRNDQIEYYI